MLLAWPQFQYKQILTKPQNGAFFSVLGMKIGLGKMVSIILHKQFVVHSIKFCSCDAK